MSTSGATNGTTSAETNPATSNPPPPDATGAELAEIRKAYLDATVGGSRFLVSTFSILAILIFLSGQEIRELDKRISEQNGIQADMTRRLTASEADLEKGRSDLLKCMENVPPPPPSGDAEAQINCQRPELKELHPALAQDKLPVRAEDLGPSELAEFQQLLKHVQALLVLESQKKLQGGKDASLIATLRYIDKSLGSYVRAFDSASQDLSKRNTAAKTIKDFQGERRKIPTPFGGFDIDPRIALLGLAWGTILTHLMFVLTIKRVRELAWRAVDQSSNPRLAGAGRTPFWVCPLPPELEAVVGVREGDRAPNGTLSVILQAGWLATSGWLVWECNRWNVYEKVLFHDPWILKYALLVALAVSAVVAIASLVQLPRLSTVGSVKPSQLDAPIPSRRRLLQVAALSVALVVIGRLSFWALPRRRQGRQPLLVGDIPKISGLVVHPKTGAAHHPVPCRGHLPLSPGSGDINAIPLAPHLHRGYETGILVALSRDANEEAAATRLLELAIERDPWNLHVYDELIRLHGRYRNYGAIGDLLERAAERAKAELGKGGTSKSVLKAAKGLEERLERTKRRGLAA